MVIYISYDNISLKIAYGKVVINVNNIIHNAAFTTFHIKIALTNVHMVIYDNSFNTIIYNNVTVTHFHMIK